MPSRRSPDISIACGKFHRLRTCITRQGPPYADAQPFARKLVAEFGDRVVWGNDWPHPNHAGPIPDEQQLVELIAEIAPTESARHALLVGNPERLYRFGEQT